MIDQKIQQLSGNDDVPVISVWKDRAGKFHIQDGQHRFVACCKLGRPVKLKLKKFGAEAFKGSWQDTAYVDVQAAKDRIARPAVKKSP